MVPEIIRGAGGGGGEEGGVAEDPQYLSTGKKAWPE